MADSRWRLGMGIVPLVFVLLACTNPVPPPKAAPTAAPVGQTTATPTTAATPTALPPIKVGALFDLSGDTSTTIGPYADAVRRYLETVNEQGGIDGRRITLTEIDYAYQVPKAVDAYKRLVGQERVVAILGWATADTEALAPLAGQDRIPYLSASYAASLVDSRTSHHYNFLIGTTYSDQMHALLKYVKDGWREPRKPNVALLTAGNALGRAPLPAAREAAGQLEIEVVDELALPFDAVDATGPLSAARNKGADFIIVNNLTPATATVLKDAASMAIKARILTLSWAVDEEVVKLAGPAAEALVGASPFTMPGEDQPGLAEIKAAYQAKGVDPGRLTARHVQGWLTAKMLVEGIKRARDKGSGESIRAGLETIRDYDTGGITPPLTWTKEDHAGNKHVRLYQVQSGRWVPVTDFIKVER